MTQITFERATSRSCQFVFCPGDATVKVFVAADVAGVLELASVDAQIAIRDVHQVFQIIESQRIIRRQRAYNAKSQPLVNQAIKGFRRSGAWLGSAGGLMQAATGFIFSIMLSMFECRFSHHTSLL